jgi:glycosyltransferase involved in cell wall biosynthesis
MKRYYMGVDWGDRLHQVYVGDEQGKKVREMKVQESPEGLAEIGHWLDENRAEGIELWAAIEKPVGRIVDFLLDHGVEVYPVNPMPVDRVRDRYRMSDSKSDAFDAYVLAEFLRNDQAHLRVLRPSSEKAQELKMLSRDQRRVGRVTPQKVSIIVPALNEEQAIEQVVRGLVTSFSNSEIIVVNDGSTDKTAILASQAGALVINHDSPRGYGAALRSGILASTRDFVLFCDADGQHRIEDVARVMAACSDCTMVVGARTTDSHVQLGRRPGKFIIRHWANILASQKIPDINSGLRIIEKSVLLKCLHLMPTGFSFSTTSTFALLKGNYSVKWVPITAQARKGQSTVKQLKQGPETMMLMLRLTVLFEPLRVFLFVTCVLLGISFASFAYDMIATNFRKVSITTEFFAISTLLVFLFGLLCDQISALRREFHDR